MSSKDYFRPRGDITTVLDLTDRDAQDNTYFPLNTEHSWFHREDNNTVHPTTMSIQEFTQRGPADWGQTCTFEGTQSGINYLIQNETYTYTNPPLNTFTLELLNLFLYKSYNFQSFVLAIISFKSINISLFNRFFNTYKVSFVSKDKFFINSMNFLV